MLNNNSPVATSAAAINAVTRAFLDGTESLSCDIDMISPQVLAYVGDTVYDLYVRTFLLCTTTCTPCVMHRLATDYVRAAAQAEVATAILPLLSQHEMAVYKRGRNSHSGNVPKNSAVTDYRMATGIEALIGYLYLRGNDARVAELMAYALKKSHCTEE